MPDDDWITCHRCGTRYNEEDEDACPKCQTGKCPECGCRDYVKGVKCPNCDFTQ